ncbi:SWIM zinc finger family protein [Micromonospora sp. DT229]|uniref:SWIM zinc finger family protein n=1 Tax=Micromonospora sp. DT229 TaxID=3393430 RepID=UPI003CF540D9
MIPAEFGSTPWGRAWVRIAGATAAAGPNALLPKARSLARNHAVELTTAPGRIEARVTASGTAYPVHIDVPIWSQQTQAEVRLLLEKSVAEQPGLIAGDLSDTFETELRQKGIAIAAGLDELGAECVCRSRKRPCVHVLATLYALSQLIDERPSLAVELRGGATEAVAPPPGWVTLTALDAAAFYGD